MHSPPLVKLFVKGVVELEALNQNKDLMSLFNNIGKEFDENVLETSRCIIEQQGCKSFSTGEIDPYQPVNDDDDNDDTTDITITKVTPAKINEPCIVRKSIPNDAIVVKKEVVNLETKKKPMKNVKFSHEEDKHLAVGIYRNMEGKHGL